MPRQRKRGYCFTLNNPGKGEIDFLHDAYHCDQEDLIKYICYAREVGKEGTPHLQGYVEFSKAIGLVRVENLIGARYHLEARLGTVKQAIDYCRKDCTEDNPLVEFGVCSSERSKRGAASGGEEEKDKWDRAYKYAKLGDFDEIPSRMMLTCYNTIKSIAKDHAIPPPDLPEVCGVWLYGFPGCGKSYFARQQWPGSYLKMANKWWDSYQSKVHTTVILDDMGMGHACLGHHLKLWADRYSFPGEVKGFVLQLRPEAFVVTSQYTIEQIWEGDEDTIAALKRRFRVVHCAKLGEKRVRKEVSRPESHKKCEWVTADASIDLPLEPPVLRRQNAVVAAYSQAEWDSVDDELDADEVRALHHESDDEAVLAARAAHC